MHELDCITRETDWLLMWDVRNFFRISRSVTYVTCLLIELMDLLLKEITIRDMTVYLFVNIPGRSLSKYVCL